ncbi:hemerythrin domain-containing protein [Caminibacter mediatlanticus]|uniref:Hemerythrin-like domain-containing protein n=1 Tax=Caminibacter mediatlanticus TB-2 TaxID=391592 RepID=A0AAI9AH01_9BACT|nr:hemerythrin domain-containing protein [Caminibacter mediatlanticus]EDM23339.1 hypothetical protein CMTB2_08745 [Caminibacter mediatlanticus TB-2]
MFVKSVSEKFNKIVKNINKPYLVKKLEKDHEVILNFLEKIKGNIKNKNYSKAFHILNEMFYSYKKHILYENNYLYPKLFKKYYGYENIIEAIKEIKDEEENISKAIDRLMIIYEAPWVIEKNHKEFLSDIENFSLILKERVDFEESRLFVLY